MKKVFLSILMLLLILKLNAQVAYRMQLLSNWNNPNLNKVDTFNIWNDLVGYYDSLTKKEYIIAGSTDSIYFFDITIPTQIKLLDVEYGSVKGVINRDYEIYQHYVYCVADQNRSSMQIYDLQYLPDSVHKVYEDSALAINTHSFFIEAKSKRLYMCSNRYGNWTKENSNESAMDIISIENPEKPTFLAKLFVPKRANGEAAFRWVHEAHVRNDTAYLSCGYSGLYIYDLRDLNNQIILGTIVNYPQAAYNHSSWLNKNGNYLMFTDENIGSNIKIFDISIIQAPRIESYFISNTWATPHNSYWFGNFAVASMYHDGVFIWNIADTKKPQLAAYYDTYPQNAIGDYTKNFAGCWGVWPYLPSGNIIASDRTNGIFVLKVDSGILNLNENIFQTTSANIYPNPANSELNISIETNYNDVFSIEIIDLEGKLIQKFNQNFKSNYLYKEDINELKNGVYFLEIKGSKSVFHKKIVKL